jgi:hypothetical protein
VGLTGVVAAEVLEEDVVPVYASVVVSADGVERGEVLEGGAGASRLLPYLPDEGLLDGLPDLDDAPRYAPLPLGRLPATLDEENLLAPYYYSGDAGDGAPGTPCSCLSLTRLGRRPLSP